MRPIISCETSKQVTTIQEAATAAKVKGDLKLRDSYMASTTEKPLQASIESSNPCVNTTSPTERPDLDKSPMSETDLSEPKTGTTTASYRTGASSPGFPNRYQTAFGLGQENSLNDEREASYTTDAQIHGYPCLELASLTKEITAIDALHIIGTQSLRQDDINIKWPHDLQSMSSNRAAESCLSEWVQFSHYSADTAPAASAPEFYPQLSKAVDFERVIENVLPEIEATSVPPYNPLAVEWSPSNQRKHAGRNRLALSKSMLKTAGDLVEDGQVRSDRPQLTVAVGKFPSFATLEQEKPFPLLRSDDEVSHLEPSSDGSGWTMSGRGNEFASGATIAGLISDITDPTVEKLSPDGGSATRPDALALYNTHLRDKPTLAQRRADRQLVQAQIRPSQTAPNTAKLRPASLLVAKEHKRNFSEASVRSSPATGFQSGEPQNISHTQSLTWKRHGNIDPSHLSVHPEWAKWGKIEQDLLRMGLIKRVPGKSDIGSFAVPKSLEQWLQFRAGRTEDLLLQSSAKIKRRDSEREESARIRRIFSTTGTHDPLIDESTQRRTIMIEPAMGGKEFHDGCCTVLAQQSIWSPWYKSTEERPEALWPCSEEMKEEGDERHTSAFGRFLALPRVPGNPTVVWKVKPVVPALLFDEIWKVPSKETWADLHSPRPDGFQQEYMNTLVGPALLDAVDC